jgi:hypothetical protein
MTMSYGLDTFLQPEIEGLDLPPQLGMVYTTLPRRGCGYLLKPGYSHDRPGVRNRGKVHKRTPMGLEIVAFWPGSYREEQDFFAKHAGAVREGNEYLAPDMPVITDLLSWLDHNDRNDSVTYTPGWDRPKIVNRLLELHHEWAAAEHGQHR